MEPLSALALLGNLLQLLDSAAKLITEARQIYHSASGITADNRDTMEVHSDFRAVAAALAYRPPRLSPSDSIAISSLAIRAQEISDDLLQRQESHRAKNPGSMRDSLLAAWRSWKDRPYLESGQKQLDRIRDQLMFRMVFLRMR